VISPKHKHYLRFSQILAYTRVARTEK